LPELSVTAPPPAPAVAARVAAAVGAVVGVAAFVAVRGTLVAVGGAVVAVGGAVVAVGGGAVAVGGGGAVVAVGGTAVAVGGGVAIAVALPQAASASKQRIVRQPKTLLMLLLRVLDMRSESSSRGLIRTESMIISIGGRILRCHYLFSPVTATHFACENPAGVLEYIMTEGVGRGIGVAHPALGAWG
jgi:hypothetical protein